MDVDQRLLHRRQARPVQAIAVFWRKGPDCRSDGFQLLSQEAGDKNRAVGRDPPCRKSKACRSPPEDDRGRTGHLSVNHRLVDQDRGARRGGCPAFSGDAMGPPISGCPALPPTPATGVSSSGEAVGDDGDVEVPTERSMPAMATKAAKASASAPGEEGREAMSTARRRGAGGDTKIRSSRR